MVCHLPCSCRVDGGGRRPTAAPAGGTQAQALPMLAICSKHVERIHTPIAPPPPPSPPSNCRPHQRRPHPIPPIPPPRSRRLRDWLDQQHALPAHCATTDGCAALEPAKHMQRHPLLSSHAVAGKGSGAVDFRFGSI
eukprot:251493-Chlamydomonas_euryale.AAC.2